MPSHMPPTAMSPPPQWSPRLKLSRSSPPLSSILPPHTPTPMLLHTLTLTHMPHMPSQLPIMPLPSVTLRLSQRLTQRLSSTATTTATQDTDTLPTDTHTTLLTDTLPHTLMDTTTTA